MFKVPVRGVAVFLLFCLAALTLAPPAFAQVPGDTGTIRGVVLDRADGSPIDDVSVRLQDARTTVKTDAAGRFELAGVTPGRHELYVSLVGFILVRRNVVVAPGAAVDLTIVLSEGTGTYSETVNVAGAERFREQEKSVPAQQTLGSAEIQNLRNLLTNDPMRAIQVLPGVTTGDDFRSEFAVRGSPFGRMNFTFDGIPTSFLLHTVQQVQDGGSIAMVNGDILDGITLLNGSYPQRYGNRIGAELDFQMREGSRDRTQTRIGVSGTDASIVVEGPLGAAKKGSWLFSGRKSYLELLLKQITDDDDDFGFGFVDAQSKIVYDLSAKQRVELSVVAGRSKLDQTAPLDEHGVVADGTNRAFLTNGAWRFSPSPRFTITSRVAVAVQRFRNVNPAGAEIGRGSAREITGRADVIATPSQRITVEGGAQVQHIQRDEEMTIGLDNLGAEQRFSIGDGGGRLSSVYGQVRWASASRGSITLGGRVDQWSVRSQGNAVPGDVAGSPWVQAEMPLFGTLKLRGGAGIHRQFPTFEEVGGPNAPRLFPNPSLRPERAFHADAGIEQTLGGSTRLQLTVYNRQEHDLVRHYGSEPQRPGVPQRPGPITSIFDWENALDGHARGVELLVQRRSNSGLSGWLSYSFGVNRYDDRLTGESFDGDYDQRHTLNAYGMQRLTNRFSLAGKLRMGSNTPVVGYWEQRHGDYFVGSTRNALRVPAYARLDLRANRTFNWQTKRLTLFVEVMNVLGRENVRYERPGVNPRTGQAFGIFSSMIPRVPSAGILIEF
jgi:hypothetical protein